jgi:hypothetical protein
MKTAVEFYREELSALVSLRETKYKTEQEIFKQAKEMEKEQVQRLIKEHEKMYEIMQALSFALSIDGKKDLANKTLLETANNAIHWRRTNL